MADEMMQCALCEKEKPAWMFSEILTPRRCAVCEAQGGMLSLAVINKLQVRYNELFRDEDGYDCEITLYERGLVFRDENNEPYDFKEMAALLQLIEDCILQKKPAEYMYIY